MSDVNINFPPAAAPTRAVTAGEVEDMVIQAKADVEGQVSAVVGQVDGVTAQLVSAEQQLAGKTNENNFETKVSTPITNLITNGNFTNGTTSWSTLIASSSVSNGELTFTATGDQGRVFQQFTFPDGHLIYRSVQVKATSNQVGLGQTSNVLKYHSGSGLYERLSHISNATTNKYISVVDRRTSAWNTVTAKNAIAINLTAYFGAGNEPTVEEMDAFLATNFIDGWFNATNKVTEMVVSAQSFASEVNKKLDNLNYSKIEVVNIKEQFGAVGDGVTNNTKAFADAVAHAKTLNDPILYLPTGNYYSLENILIDGIRRIAFEGAVKLATGKMLDVVYDAFKANAEWKFSDVTVGKLRLSGLNSSNVIVNKAKELELYAHGDTPIREFMAYNTFILGKVDTFKIWSEGPIKAGWINENKFFGGRFINFSMDGNFSHDNNIFYGTMLEGFTFTLNRGNSNYFYDVRMEGTNTITFGAQAVNNFIYRSYHETPYQYLRDTVSLPYTNNGMNNQVISNLDTIYKKTPIISINSNSNNFSLAALTKNQYDLTVVTSSQKLFESDLIELKTPFGIIAKSDKSLFNIYLYAYDVNKNLLLTEQSNFTSLSGGSFNTGTGAYGFGANVGIVNTGVPVFPNGIVKYIKYVIQTGSSTVGQTFNYLDVIKNESNVYQTDVKHSNKYKRLTSATMPTAGYFESGDIVWNTGTDNAIAFWRRLTTGTSHVLDADWKAHG